MNSVNDSWRDQVQVFDRAMAALRERREQDGHEQGRPSGFGYTDRPMNPHRTDDPALNCLFAVLGSGKEVLDVGGGSGRFALPLATRAERVTVVDPSADSIDLLKERAADAGITNVTTINEQWEDANVPAADLVLCSLVLHHVSEPAPFVARLQQHARNRVALLEMVQTPGVVNNPFFERVHGKPLPPLPGLARLMDLLWAMDIYPDVEMITPEPAVVGPDLDTALGELRFRLAVREGTGEDERLRAAADELLEETADGITVRRVDPLRQAVVTWRPNG